MSKTAGADEYLVERIRQGDDRAWTQLVHRFEGRLTVFARRQLPRNIDAEDLVQDTFISFIRSLKAFRSQCGLESYLFTILRRKIIDSYRRAGSSRVGLIQDLYGRDSGEEEGDFLPAAASPEPTASWYLRRDEGKEQLAEAFAKALLSLLGGMKKSLQFDHLKIVELLFFCQLSNTDTAAVLKIDPSRVGVVKHRCLKQIQEALAEIRLPSLSETDSEGILVRVWRQYRPSCPKRNTIGAYLLGTLDPEWHDYADFHLHTLGCHFCQANLEDLKQQNEQKGSEKLQQRILESTVGFLPARP